MSRPGQTKVQVRPKADDGKKAKLEIKTTYNLHYAKSCDLIVFTLLLCLFFTGILAHKRFYPNDSLFSFILDLLSM